MQADTPQVAYEVQRSLLNESATTLQISSYDLNPPPLTVNDARRIIDCLRANPRFHTLAIWRFLINNAAVLRVFRDGLPLCTAVTEVILSEARLGNEGIEYLSPAFFNTGVTALSFYRFNNIRGQRGGEVIRDLLVGNNTLLELILGDNPIGPNGAIVLGQGLTDNHRLQKLILYRCILGNDGLANLLLSMGEANNNVLTHLELDANEIKGTEGGRQVTLLLQRFPKLKVLELNLNCSLGQLGASAMAPGLTTPNIGLERLSLRRCYLGNDGVASLIPDGQVNRSLISLDLREENRIQGTVGGENVIALASRCTNLESLALDENILSADQRSRLNLLLDRKRLCTEASELGGSPFSVLFRAVEEAHRHEHGLSAIFVILQNDGEDYFHTALNREIE